jgi:Cu2+-exporting ATPase
MVDEARSVKPHRAAVADRLSGWFVAAVLIIASAVAVTWSFIDPSRAFWVMLSVLVVTCPCALSLATPAALTVATGELRKKGFLIRKPHVLETLGQLDHCIFDKTGTLTLGRMRIANVEPTEGYSKDQLLIIAAALERGSKHPIARAFKGLGYSLPQVENQRSLVGLGVTGDIEGSSYAFGKPELIEQTFSFLPQLTESGVNSSQVLANAEGVIGWVQLDDGIREGVEGTLTDLEKSGLEVELLSGDRTEVVAAMAARLGISTWLGGVAPEEKLARIQQLQGLGHRVLMVGDGINDVPVLSGADVSIAMGDAADFTRLHADSLLVSGKLTTIPEAIKLARKTSNIIKQNLGWALFYNVLALPLAAMGYVPPWAAAIGMSTSSLIVVANGLRLSGKSRPQGQT